MSKDKNKAYLIHIIESIDLIDVHLSLLKNGEPWFRHPTVREAVLRTLQVMAESCQRISEDMKAQAPKVEWGKISGFRNFLVHEYLGDMDYSAVSTVIHRELPELKQYISNLYTQNYP